GWWAQTCAFLMTVSDEGSQHAVQELITTFCGRDPFPVCSQKPLMCQGFYPLSQVAERQPRQRFVLRDGKAFAQAQGVEQKLQRQFLLCIRSAVGKIGITGDQILFRLGFAVPRGLQIVVRLFAFAHTQNPALQWLRNFSVCTGSNAEVVAKTPVVQIVT